MSLDTTLPPLELQDALQRFTTQFSDRVTQAMEGLELSSQARVRDEALRKNLLYVSSALEIASGLDPEVNLLDMLVFVHLSRATIEKHWIPTVYREKGADLAEVFARSEQELQALAEQALTPAQHAQLMNVADTWLAENPQQIRVEGIRLADFARMAGSAAADRAMQTRGLLSSVSTASRAANQALLLTERGLFLLHRMPSVWRLQARLAARDMVADVATQLFEGGDAPVARIARQARWIALLCAVGLAALVAVGVLVFLLAGRGSG
jgi:hypothetical protein